MTAASPGAGDRGTQVPGAADCLAQSQYRGNTHAPSVPDPLSDGWSGWRHHAPSPLTWVVGSGGLVGSHVTSALRAAGHDVLTTAVPWGDEARTLRALDAGVAEFARQRRGRPWAVAWCAGAGVVATGPQALAGEVRVFRHAMAALTESWAPGDADGVLFLASSAGGVYAGSSGPPFDEATIEQPLVAYGHAKLEMEAVAAGLAGERGVRVVLGRLANVYGPGQRLTKPQGLISQLCLADATGRPLPLFVSMDTIRDYLYAPDAARMIERSMALARAESPGTVTVKVLASGDPVTVGYVVSSARRVFHRRLRTIPVWGAGRGQVLDLRLRSRVWPEVDRLAVTTLVSGLSRTAADVRGRVVSGQPLDA